MRVLFLAAFAALVATGAVRADAPPLTIATGEFEPYTGQNLPGDGAVNQVVRLVAERAGYDVEFAYMPWKRTLEATRRGMYSASSYWYYRQDREADFIHVGPIVDAREVFFVRADAGLEDWTELADFAELRIGVVPGYTYTPELWDMANSGELTVSEAASDEANLKKLLAGRIDVYPMEVQGGWHLIRQRFSSEEAEQFAILETPLSVTGGYLLLPRSIPESAEIATALQAAIEDMQAGQ